MKVGRFIWKLVRDVVQWGYQRAPVPVYDVTDEDLDKIEADRANKRKRGGSGVDHQKDR